jgi:hypothetical protein
VPAVCSHMHAHTTCTITTITIQLGQEISHDELHEYKNHFNVINQDAGGESSSEPAGKFWAALGGQPKQIPVRDNASQTEPPPAKLSKYCADAGTCSPPYWFCSFCAKSTAVCSVLRVI